MASKTGTAELDDPNATPVTWYIAFGPSTNAQVALAVVVENGRNGVKSVGADLAPIGREVINAVVGGGGR